MISFYVHLHVPTSVVDWFGTLCVCTHHTQTGQSELDVSQYVIIAE